MLYYLKKKNYQKEKWRIKKTQHRCIHFTVAFGLLRVKDIYIGLYWLVYWSPSSFRRMGTLRNIDRFFMHWGWGRLRPVRSRLPTSLAAMNYGLTLL